MARGGSEKQHGGDDIIDDGEDDVMAEMMDNISMEYDLSTRQTAAALVSYLCLFPLGRTGPSIAFGVGERRGVFRYN